MMNVRIGTGAVHLFVYIYFLPEAVVLCCLMYPMPHYVVFCLFGAYLCLLLEACCC